MKRYIILLFISYLICDVSSAQISGIVKWIPDTDFSVQTNNEYTEMLNSV